MFTREISTLHVESALLELVRSDFTALQAASERFEQSNGKFIVGTIVWLLIFVNIFAFSVIFQI